MSDLQCHLCRGKPSKDWRCGRCNRSQSLVKDRIVTLMQIGFKGNWHGQQPTVLWSGKNLSNVWGYCVVPEPFQHSWTEDNEVFDV